MFRPEPFRCEVREGRAWGVVTPHGELDLATVEEARAALRSLLTKRSVTLDLRELSFIDSTGVRLILEIDALARQDGFDFCMVRGGPDVHRVFELTGVGDHLRFVDAPEDLIPPGESGKPRQSACLPGAKAAPVRRDPVLRMDALVVDRAASDPPSAVSTPAQCPPILPV